MKQRYAVRVALEAWLIDLNLHMAGTGFTGNALYVQERNEWWFETWTRWKGHGVSQRSIGWAHCFADLAEFDRITGNPDHPDTYGMRLVETVGEALAGEFE